MKARNPLGKQTGSMALYGRKKKSSLKSLLHFADFFRRFIYQIDHLDGILAK